MAQSSFLSFDSDRHILPDATEFVIAKTALPLRLHRLYIDPEIAKCFTISDVRIGVRPLLANVSRSGISAEQFSVGSGLRFEAGPVLPGIETVLTVTCISRLEIGSPFRATWQATVIPFDEAVRLYREHGSQDPALDPGAEDVVSRLDRVADVLRSPTIAQRSPASFGWDPYGGVDE